MEPWDFEGDSKLSHNGETLNMTNDQSLGSSLGGTPIWRNSPIVVFVCWSYPVWGSFDPSPVKWLTACLDLGLEPIGHVKYCRSEWGHACVKPGWKCCLLKGSTWHTWLHILSMFFLDTLLLAGFRDRPCPMPFHIKSVDLWWTGGLDDGLSTLPGWKIDPGGSLEITEISKMGPFPSLQHLWTTVASLTDEQNSGCQPAVLFWSKAVIGLSRCWICISISMYLIYSIPCHSIPLNSLPFYPCKDRW